MATATRNRTETVPLGDLIYDSTIYPRRDIDGHNITALRMAIEAGVDLPPIIIERSTKRIVDGVHRYRAFLQLGWKAEHQIRVIANEYTSDAELFADAIQRNATHGKRLTEIDLSSIALRAEILGLTRERIVSLLSMTRERYDSLTKDRIATFEKSPIIVKRSVRHMAGQEFTGGQAAANEKLSGWSPSFHARQLVLLLQEEMVDLTDDQTVQDLRQLVQVLAKALSAIPA